MWLLVFDDLGAWPAAISMLNRGYNEATTRKLSNVLRIVGSSTGHAVGEDHDREAVLDRKRVNFELWR